MLLRTSSHTMGSSVGHTCGHTHAWIGEWWAMQHTNENGAQQQESTSVTRDMVTGGNLEASGHLQEGDGA
jgi:hypothetical protein